MKHRCITPSVLAALADTPVVFVQGPRQSGKTTLVQSLHEHGHSAEYRTLDDAAGWPAWWSGLFAAAFRRRWREQTRARRAAWFGSYLTTILERDVRDLSNVQNLSDLSRLLRLLAARTSGALNLVFFVRTLPTWSGNLTSRLAKAPKVLLNLKTAVEWPKRTKKTEREEVLNRAPFIRQVSLRSGASPSHSFASFRFFRLNCRF